MTDIVDLARKSLELAEKATPPPWWGDKCPIDEYWAELYDADYLFITHARTALPLLAQAVIDLSAEVERLNKKAEFLG